MKYLSGPYRQGLSAIDGMTVRLRLKDRTTPPFLTQLERHTNIGLTLKIVLHPSQIGAARRTSAATCIKNPYFTINYAVFARVSDEAELCVWHKMTLLEHSWRSLVALLVKTSSSLYPTVIKPIKRIIVVLTAVFIFSVTAECLYFGVVLTGNQPIQVADLIVEG